jgi:hypothetical protein
MKRALVRIAVALACAVPAFGQQSASYALEEHVLNAGGRPRNGIALASTSFRVSLDAIGEGVNLAGLSSASFQLDAGFGVAYPPPGEVGGLRFSDHQTLLWDPEPSIGDYNVYRDLVSNLAALGFGTCMQQALTVETATDADPVPSGAAYFYLVTAENLLDEEGTKGFQSNGLERGGNICP